jgi:predicted MPP superfamily phosphohydrolase
MTRRRLTRRAVLLGASVLAAASVAQAASGGEAFDVTQRELVVPGLDPRHDGLKVVQISDVHLGASTPDRRVERAVRTINALQPDLVFLTGDYVTFSRRTLPRVAPRLAGIEAPTFAVLGNHDHWVDAAAVRRALEADGYPVLQNQSVPFPVRGAPVWIVGVDDAQTGHQDVARAFAGVPATGTRLVLAHQPTSADALPENGNLVCFSGHTHGGQINLPGLTESIARRLGQPYLRGAYRVRGNWLYVNSGLGYGKGGAAVRLRVPPEISVITLRAG